MKLKAISEDFINMYNIYLYQLIRTQVAIFAILEMNMIL